MEASPDPLQTAPADDTGAETLRRYRYQAAYAAWLAVGSLHEMPEVIAVYCEHHEDVLLELDSQVCDAVQVKTQGDDVGPLRGTNEVVLGTLRRFVSLEQSFNGRFRRYRLASITGFYGSGNSASNLPLCLEQARNCVDPSPVEKPLVTLIGKLKIAKSISVTKVLAALRKIELDSSLPKLADVELRVRLAIEQLPEAAGYRASEVAAAAEAVIALAAAAGEATKDTAASDYVAYMDDPDGHTARAAIEAKRLEREVVRERIREAVSATARLRSQGGADVAVLPTGSNRAHIKLDAGGLPAHTVGLLDDLRASVEDEISRRLYRDGTEQTNSDYDHLQVLVRSLAEEARLATRAPGAEYGQKMLSELQTRLRDQLARDASSLRGLSVEQLTGLAAILTELCEVWWSEPFDLPAAA